jgi:hypothetical protein
VGNGCDAPIQAIAVPPSNCRFEPATDVRRTGVTLDDPQRSTDKPSRLAYDKLLTDAVTLLAR